MTIWTIFQVVINIIFFVGFIIIWNRSLRRSKDDPRLSRGLQLLQSKISVLEDLSDRTDLQVKQLIKILETKTRQLQTKIFESEKQMQRIDQSMHKSLEVANIFQDKIPHEEIIERQNSVKYIQAAQLAHQGKSVEEIVKLVGLSKGEVEFIAKVNKDQLMFDEETLPAWAKQQVTAGIDSADSVDQLLQQSYEKAFEIPTADLASLERLGDEFRSACKDHDQQIRKEEQQIIDFNPQLEKAKAWSQEVARHAGQISQKMANQTGEITKKAFDKTGAVTQRAAHRGAELTSRVTHQTSEALHGVSKKISERASKTFDQLIDAEDGLSKELKPMHELNFSTESSEDRGENNDVIKPQSKTPMATHQQSMFNAIQNKELSSEPNQNLNKMSLSELLDAKKKKSYTVIRDVEVKKVIFPNLDAPNS